MDRAGCVLLLCFLQVPSLAGGRTRVSPSLSLFPRLKNQSAPPPPEAASSLARAWNLAITNCVASMNLLAHSDMHALLLGGKGAAGGAREAGVPADVGDAGDGLLDLDGEFLIVLRGRG